ncbi:hypothetical protein EBZ35_00190 [bacterium]|nr:hypothetical protein [bacterium]
MTQPRHDRMLGHKVATHSVWLSVSKPLHINSMISAHVTAISRYDEVPVIRVFIDSSPHFMITLLLT